MASQIEERYRRLSLSVVTEHMVHGYRASVGQSRRPVVAVWVSWSDATAPTAPDHSSASRFVRAPTSDLF